MVLYSHSVKCSLDNSAR